MNIWKQTFLFKCISKLLPSWSNHLKRENEIKKKKKKEFFDLINK